MEETLDAFLRAMTLPEARRACRERGLSPAGGVRQLVDRLKEYALATGDR